MVDFGSTEFDLRDAADKGSWCEFIHPVTRQPLSDGDDKPCRVLIQGIDALGFDKAIAKTASLQLNETAYRGPITDEFLLMSVDKAARTQGRELSEISLEWENLEWEGEPVASRTIARNMYASRKWIREQLLAHISERNNYAGNVSAPSSNGRVNPAGQTPPQKAKR